MTSIRTCEFWLPKRRQCGDTASGLYRWNRTTLLDGSHAFLVGFGRGPATAICAGHLALFIKLAGKPDRQSAPDAEQW